MISSRSALVGRVVANVLLRSSKNAAQKQIVRHGHGAFSYRSAPTPNSKYVVLAANVGGGIAWWWILWHLWHEPEHITGEFPYIEPSTWTNAELGIPPDDDE
ncbi:NADH dehydrogenase [ubiquinone] 1 beta subcomplex subunit 2, mitochondrial-like [Phlebotomus argentipes]|uniref:NADH dehydrogenase [ubiquinone] 1 beta subcomplex subunit 2, mitochondrial-like n=1 Tax=Phlebotomus argentipes TaxID=94469 RepID=UPI002892AAF2|nr:NADH dehydrogenase [ubiquinone] 1 beta subcomplex subunit 2, mitochondrial-like [Phlebotomus argentipes]